MNYYILDTHKLIVNNILIIITYARVEYSKFLLKKRRKKAAGNCKFCIALGVERGVGLPKWWTRVHLPHLTAHCQLTIFPFCPSPPNSPRNSTTRQRSRDPPHVICCVTFIYLFITHTLIWINLFSTILFSFNILTVYVEYYGRMWCRIKPFLEHIFMAACIYSCSLFLHSNIIYKVYLT